MKLPLSDNSRPDSWSSKLRRRRIAQFLEIVPEAKENVRILDLGGSEEAWMNIWDHRLERTSITILNSEEKRVSGRFPMTAIVGDARDLSQFDTREFDLCFSNSLIEHLGTFADQTNAANEIRRVAKGYFIQTPYRYFVLEPHFHLPYWAQLPLELRVALHRRFNLGWMRAQPDSQRARIEVEQIRLLTVREMRDLFPDGEIRKEKIGPLVKSLVAVKQVKSA
ncbi:MAG TPA: methyltransferase domain-containing protein [Bryobacteraceae bacterium]|nr:methyltransferase domain-containing protein [Bryobacteraceae bacterium]